MFALSLPMPTALALTFELALLMPLITRVVTVIVIIAYYHCQFRIVFQTEMNHVSSMYPHYLKSIDNSTTLTIHFGRYRVNGNWIVIYRSMNFHVEIRFRKKKENEIKSANIIRSNCETQISNDHRFWYTCCTKFCYHQAITVERTTLVKNGIAIFFFH